MQKERNEQFVILSGIGMILVMLGHLNLPILTFGGLLPYYSYHVMLFVFISGYFYQEKEEAHIFSYVKRKACHLLLPYACFNVMYGIIITLIHRFSGMGVWFGEDISLYNLIIAPFLSGHQFMLHAAAWFVPALFLLLLCNIVGRRILSLLRIKNEYVITLLYFLMGFAVVYLAKRGSVYDYYKLPGRLMLMAPMLQLGHLYRTKLEEKDTLPSILYFLILIVLQGTIIWYTGGRVGYSVVWVTGFANGVIMPFLTAAIGIFFWLRVARLLGRWSMGTSKLMNGILWIGNHSFSVMMHHLFGFFLLNVILYQLHEAFSLFPAFDVETFRGDIYYTYCSSGGNPLWYVPYLIFGLLTAYLLDKLAQMLYCTIRRS